MLCYDADTGVNCRLYFHSCTDYRSFCLKKRHGLTLHVRSHKGTVCVVVLQERDQRCSNREHHLRRNVHIIKHTSLVFLRLLAVTTGYVLTDEMSFLIKRLVRLCYVVIILFIRCHVYNFFRNARIFWISFINLAVWCLYKTILIDSCIACQ